jgi:hypothetical protein
MNRWWPGDHCGGELAKVRARRLRSGTQPTFRFRTAVQTASDIGVIKLVRRVRPARGYCCLERMLRPERHESVFSGRFARRQSRRYRRRGLTPAARGIVDFATSRGIAGATVWEIGGGVGQIQVQLLRRSASHVTNP